MIQRAAITRQITGTVLEVLPSTGLAYLADEESGTWAVTRSTRGRGLQSLRPGQRLALTVLEEPDFAVVTDYVPID